MGIKYNWLYPKYDNQFIKTLEESRVSNTTSKILSTRGINTLEEARKYLSSEYEEGYDPFLMYDMEKAVVRINEAIENEEKILVYGDYDADGITSTVLLVETLVSLGADVGSYIPNRFEEGYGPNKEAFKKIIESGISLIITVDNGIAGIEEVALANELGCDVIVTDHHKIQDELPQAYAIIHPEHPKGNYPFGKLAGVGVAFKLSHALLGIYPDFLLDLVAIGTVADMVPLVDENRIFVKQGLELLNEDARLGIKMMLEMSNIEFPIDEQTIGFYIAPKLNSIGRMDSAKMGLAFLTAENVEHAKLLAEQIDEYNIERKAVTENIVKDVIEKVGDRPQNSVILAYSENYHEGVLGIVASNIAEKYKKPTLIMNLKDGKLKGSARSVYEFNIYEAMNNSSELFLAFGGHTLAAGFSLDVANVEALQKTLDEQFDNYVENNDLKSNKTIDLVTTLEEVSYPYVSSLEQLKPFGMDFEKPHVLLENSKVVGKSLFGSDKQYLRLTIADEITTLECITFKDTDIFSEVKMGDTIDLLCTLEKNKFNGRTKLQGHIIDIEVKDFLFEDYRNYNIKLEELPNDCLKLSKTVENVDNNFYKYRNIDEVQERFEEIYLLDIPTSKNDVEKLIALKPQKIYVACSEKKLLSEQYKIDKQRLIAFFNLLLKSPNKKLSVVSDLQLILKKLATNVDSLKIMIEIFKELKLITFENNMIIVNENYESVDLKNSPSFVAMENRFTMENIFLKQNIEQINNIFIKNNDK